VNSRPRPPRARNPRAIPRKVGCSTSLTSWESTPRPSTEPASRTPLIRGIAPGMVFAQRFTKTLRLAGASNLTAGQSEAPTQSTDSARHGTPGSSDTTLQTGAGTKMSSQQHLAEARAAHGLSGTREDGLRRATTNWTPNTTPPVGQPPRPTCGQWRTSAASYGQEREIWRRGESNPRPVIPRRKRLRV
jgi:hypothetical protein